MSSLDFGGVEGVGFEFGFGFGGSRKEGVAMRVMT